MGQQDRSIHQPEAANPKGLSRRNLLKIAAATGSALTLSNLPSEWSKPVLEVGYLSAHAQMSPVLGSGDFQATLRWNAGNIESPVDIDLHTIEPDGSLVYYADPQGPTALLDVDNVVGLGPENIFVGAGAAANGVYQVYVVYFDGAVFPTTATITIRVFANTAQEQSVTFTRNLTQADPSLGVNVANVTFPAGTITETSGTRGVAVAAQASSKSGQ